MSETAATPGLETLFQQHRPALEQAAGNRGWRTMPPGGREAIRAGIVEEADPTWMYSDDPRACNGFRLTALGREIMHHQGYTCRCAGCNLDSGGPGLTLGKYCQMCEAGINQYGSQETSQGTMCRFHARRACLR